MPIPFILAGLAVVAGGLGVAGALDAKEKMDLHLFFCSAIFTCPLF